MTLKILIYGTTYIDDATKRELLKLWVKCHEHNNADCDIVVIDAPSPYGVEKVLPDWAWSVEGETRRSASRIVDIWSRAVYSFTENVGHLNRTGRDGAGRAFVQGMKLAIEGGYDYCIHNECDLIMTTPIRPWIERMHKHSVKVASPFDSYYQFGEWGLSFFNVDWLRETDFVGRYDWENQHGLPIPEVVIGQLAGDEYFTLPIRGVRNDFHQITRQAVSQAFPSGLDYLTHCYKDFEIYRELMKRNGVPL